MKQQKSKISVLEQQLRQNETLYHNACEVFGGSPRVFRHYSPAEEMSIDILTGTDTPRQGEVSCATLGVMHYPVGQRAGKSRCVLNSAVYAVQNTKIFLNLSADAPYRL